MGANTQIEWCDNTFNPWEGCTKVSPGCLHCYAETRNARFGGGTAPNWGKGAPRRRTSVHNWNEPRRWNKVEGLERDAWEGTKTLSTGHPPRRPRVFCASLADWLDDEVPIEWTADFLALVHECENLDFLLLTKRPGLWRERLEAAWNWSVDHDDEAVEFRLWLRAWIDGRPPFNVWIGTTVEDQKRADERIPQLLLIPAKVRFLSCEPLLGPVDLDFGHPKWRRAESYHSYIHWVICGGESGPKARPMHPGWARSLRDQCQAVSVPFFFKQWGEWLPQFERMQGERRVNKLQEYNWGCGVYAHRVGKKAAGSLLDGIEHKAFPEVKP